jgi:hypothetical protein
MDRDGNGDGDRDTNIDKEINAAEIYADGSDTPRKFVLRDMIPRRNLLRAVWYPTEICLERSDRSQKFVPRGMIPQRTFFGGVIPRGNLFRGV